MQSHSLINSRAASNILLNVLNHQWRRRGLYGVAQGTVRRRICLPVLAVSLFVVFACTCDDHRPAAAEVVYTVTKVRDGDSFSATAKGATLEVRLFGIDAPEYDQPYATESRREAERLLNNANVMLTIIEFDRFNRAVAWVYLPGDSVSVNARLVERGAAWVYRRYTHDGELLAHEKQAKTRAVGLWAVSDEAPTPPWEWRRRKRD